MTVFEYYQMPEKDQLNLLKQRGVQVGERESAFCHVELYQLDAFYVEVYHHNHFNVVVNINPFTNTDCLEPYLTDVDIDTLLYA